MVSTRGVKFKYTEGERVLCYEPDPTKAKVLYESKVLDLVVTRDNKGRKVSEYLVHFYGWNSSWDRCVHEDFVLSDNEENRALQKRLAEEASINLKGKKRLHKIGALLKDSFHKKKCSDRTKENGTDSKDGSTWQESDSSQDEETSDDEMDEETEEEEEEEEEENAPYQELQITDHLKSKLEDDCLNVTTHHKLLKLPCDPSVIDILETYVKQLGVSLLCSTADTKEKQLSSAHSQHMKIQNKIHLAKEMADGLRVCFDFTLPLVLLYKQERPQFKDIISKPFLIKQREPTPLLNFTSLNPMASQSADSIRTRERVLSTSPHHPSTDSPKNKMVIEPNCSPPSQQGDDGHTLPASRSRFRSSRDNHSPPNSSGDEGQRLRRVLRSTERLRLEEDGCKKADVSLELEPVSGPDSPTISFKPIPPGSPILPMEAPQSSASSKGEGSSASSSHSDSTVEQPVEVKEAIPDSTGLLNDLMTWQLLPTHLCLNQNVHTPPSLVYGAHHLLRLFVKLPDYLDQMSIPKNKRGSLIKHLKAFIHYLDEKCEHLILASAYTDLDDNC